MTMTKDEFLHLLTPERRAFMLDCVRGGWADYEDSNNYGAAARRDHSQSVRAQCRNSHIVARALRGIVEHPEIGIQVSQRGQRVLFIVGDQARVSFKKLDRRLRPRNYPTRQARAFLGQRLPWANEPAEITNLLVGYRPNAAETEFEVFATCPQDADNEWQMKLSRTEAVDFFDATSAARIEDALIARVSRKRVRIRKDPKEASDALGASEGGD